MAATGILGFPGDLPKGTAQEIAGFNQLLCECQKQVWSGFAAVGFTALKVTS
jgi:hypothetical protein